MTNAPRPDLLPCPFCGAPAEICDVYQSVNCSNEECPIGPWTNHVGQIGADDDEAWMAEAARRWNTRAPRENAKPKERPFGGISIGAELAVSMGMDPRQYLTEDQIAEQLRRTGTTREEWDAAWDRICKVAGDYSDVPF